MIEDVQAQYASLAAEARKTKPTIRSSETVGTWAGTTDKKIVFLSTGKFRANGSEILRRIVIHYVVLTRPDREEMRFTVTHITNKSTGFRSTTITDKRGNNTGHAGTSGIWGTRVPMPAANRTVSHTPTSWIMEVAPRFITRERALELLYEAGYDGSTRSL